MDGKFSGPHYQKQPRSVVNSSAVDVRRGAEDIANVSRQHFSALPFATVVNCVLRNNIAFHWSVVNSSAVDVRRGAEDIANVSRQHFSALPFATVVDCVLRNNIAFH